MGLICIPGYQHQYIKALHERYGDVVRIGTCIGRLPLWGISIWGTGCSIAEQGLGPLPWWKSQQEGGEEDAMEEG